MNAEDRVNKLFDINRESTFTNIEFSLVKLILMDSEDYAKKLGFDHDVTTFFVNIPDDIIETNMVTYVATNVNCPNISKPNIFV